MNAQRLHKTFFFLLLVFLPTQLGKHFWPQWAFVLGRRVDYLSPTVYLTDLLLLATVGSWILSMLLESFPRRRESRLQKLDPRVKPEDDKKRRLQENKKNILRIFPLLCFFIFAGLNIFFANNKPVVLYHWLKVLEFGLLALYIMRARPKIHDIVFPLSIGVLYSSLIAIGQFVLQHSVSLWILGERTFTVNTPGIARTVLCQFSIFNFQFSKAGCISLLRAYGTFPHPNVLGGFLVVTLPLVFNFQLSISNQTKKLSKQQLFYGVTFLLGMVALLLTFSRSAMVIAVAMTVVSSWKLVVRKKFLSIFFVLIALTTSCYLLATFSLKDESVVVRQQLNQAAVTQFVSSPLVGVGLGNFLVELPKTLFSKGVYFLQPAHNIYLLVLSELGIIGVLLVLWSFLRVVSRWKLVVGKNRNKKATRESQLLFLSCVALLLLGLVDHYMLTLQQGQLLFMIFASFFLATIY